MNILISSHSNGVDIDFSQCRGRCCISDWGMCSGSARLLRASAIDLLCIFIFEFILFALSSSMCESPEDRVHMR